MPLARAQSHRQVPADIRRLLSTRAALAEGAAVAA
jgi:hypothetical protein